MRKVTIFIGIALAFIGSACVQNGSNGERVNLEYDSLLILPNGFKAIVVADNLGRARHLTVRQNGDVYVSLRQKKENGGMVALRDTTGNSKADVIQYFGDREGTGIHLKGAYLYYSDDLNVCRILMNPDGLLPVGTEEVIVTGFEEQNQHSDKTFSLDEKGNLYVNVGAPSNACMQETRTPGSPGLDPCPQLERHAGIWKFDANRLGQTQVDDGRHYATGIRNAVAITWNEQIGELYALQHGRDQLSQFFPDLFDSKQNAELPSEEFLQVKENSDFGWPYCYYDHIKGKRILAPEYGGDSETEGRCTAKDDPILAFSGHLAPNDLLFYKGQMYPDRYQQGAFIAFHGSWNRAPEPQEGYCVAFVPMKEGLPVGNWEIFADGFDGANSLESPGDALYRPCGLAEGPDGAIWVVDSQKGRVWKIIYNKNDE